MNLDAAPETLEALDDIVAKGLVESTGYVLRHPGPLMRVCLTGKGWVRGTSRNCENGLAPEQIRSPRSMGEWR